MSNPSEFHRVISVRSFFGPGLWPATLCGIFSGLLLSCLVFLGGALSWLLVERSARNAATPDSGLLPLADTLMTAPGGASLARLIRALGPLHSSASAAVCLILAGAILLLIRWTFRSLARTLLNQHIAGIILRIRQHIHRKAIRLEPADLTGEQARMTDRLFQDSTFSLETAATRWGQLWVTVLPDLVAVVLTALTLNWRVALQTVIPIVLGRMALHAESHRSDASMRLLAEQVNRGLGRMAEGLRKTRIVTSYGMEPTEHQQFASHLGEYQKRCRRMQRQQSMARGIRNILLMIVVIIPLSILALRVLNGDHAAAGLMIAGCLAIAYRSLNILEQRTQLASDGAEKADEITTYLHRVPSVSQAPGAGFLEPMAKTLTFNQIAFQTPQLPGLVRGLDLRINFGEKVALLSLQPAAAHAVASMISRFIDPDLGQVLIDGRDIRMATLESLRAEAVFVGGQDPVFNATVLENITCGQSDISRQQAQDAAKLAHADHFIRTLPRGYETVLGEHGVTLDPGQIFRLSLARAAVRSPALLVIEEPPVALDAETKALLDDAYQRISSSRTVIFLPHRLSTVKKCSRIVMIHDGRVAVDGVHDQLVRTSELYRHWEYLRFNPFRDDVE